MYIRRQKIFILTFDSLSVVPTCEMRDVLDPRTAWRVLTSLSVQGQTYFSPCQTNLKLLMCSANQSTALLHYVVFRQGSSQRSTIHSGGLASWFHSNSNEQSRAQLATHQRKGSLFHCGGIFFVDTKHIDCTNFHHDVCKKQPGLPTPCCATSPTQPMDC